MYFFWWCAKLFNIFLHTMKHIQSVNSNKNARANWTTPAMKMATETPANIVHSSLRKCWKGPNFLVVICGIFWIIFWLFTSVFWTLSSCFVILNACEESRCARYVMNDEILPVAQDDELNLLLLLSAQTEDYV